MELMELNLDEQAEWMEEFTGLGYEEAMEYLVVEDDYFDLVGINYYPDDDGNYADIQLPCVKIDDEIMLAYIEKNSSLSKEAIEMLYDAEMEYLYRNGFLEPDFPEWDEA